MTVQQVLISTAFVVLCVIALAFHLTAFEEADQDLKLVTLERDSSFLIEVGKMLRGTELARAIKMGLLLVAGISSFFPGVVTSRMLVFMSLFCLPIISIADGVITRRSVKKQLRMAAQSEIVEESA